MATLCEWKAKYRTAVFETNRRALPTEIAEAENAIIARARELSEDGRRCRFAERRIGRSFVYPSGILAVSPQRS
jgi:hypothetical protein